MCKENLIDNWKWRNAQNLSKHIVNVLGIDKNNNEDKDKDQDNANEDCDNGKDNSIFEVNGIEQEERPD